MIDKNESFYPVHKIQQQEGDLYCVGVAFYQDGLCAARQACVMPAGAAVGVTDLSFRSRCSVADAVKTIHTFLVSAPVTGSKALTPEARLALSDLSAALRRGQLVLGSGTLTGNECNREAVVS